MNQPTHRRKYAVAVALAMLPALFILGAIIHLGVDVPYADEWLTPGELLVKLCEKEATADDFLKLYSQHRPIVPRLLGVALAYTSGFNMKAFMVLGWCCAVATCLLLLRMLARSTSTWSCTFLLFALLIGLLMFSPALYQGWLWATVSFCFIPSLAFSN